MVVDLATVFLIFLLSFCTRWFPSGSWQTFMSYLGEGLDSESGFELLVGFKLQIRSGNFNQAGASFRPAKYRRWYLDSIHDSGGPGTYSPPKGWCHERVKRRGWRSDEHEAEAHRKGEREASTWLVNTT